MGLPPHRIRQYDRYLREVKPLLRGEETNIRHGEQNIPIRHVMPDKGFVNFDDPVPMYVSGFGPRSLAIAGEHGDGAVRSPMCMLRVLRSHHVRKPPLPDLPK